MLYLFIKFLVLHVVTYISMHDIAVGISFAKHTYIHLNNLVDVNSFLEISNQYFNTRPRVFYIQLILKYIFGVSYKFYYGCEDLDSSILYDAVHDSTLITEESQKKLDAMSDLDRENVRVQRLIYSVMIVNMLIGVFFYMK